ncbi:MAG: aspartate--tRNA ligase [Deltaproteobacteria bacterium]|nr:aspartate--tRNA ligase [Deltaproteobacteria bacterium]
MSFLKSTYRTHTCGELRAEHVGQEVVISGWLLRKRDHGGLVFIDLRDNYGLTQVIASGELGQELQKPRVESVLRIRGTVVAREKNLINSKLATGEIEVKATSIEVLSAAEVIPFQVAEDDNAPETTRLTYRFLELRREKLHRNILLKNHIIRAMREIMWSMNFNEFQTPILTSSSPEGARDFIVPSRLHPGKFFALPQAPQQFKQLLMISGFDRYFQIAPCFRDEDARADRSPGEFYQLDMELSYVEQEDVMRVNENLLTQLFPRFSKGRMTDAPFPRLRYDDAMARYGTDKPDLRVPLEIANVSQVFANSEFRVFKSALGTLGGIWAIKMSVSTPPSRKYYDDAVDWFQKSCGQGLAYLSFDENGYKGSIGKFVSASEADALKAALQISGPAVVWLAAGAEKEILSGLGRLRVKLGTDFNLTEKDAWRFCWVTDMKFYERNEDTGGIDFVHNPFSMPQGGMDALLSKNPLDIYAYQYDIVCNGYELASGGIRNHLPQIMYKAFEIVGYSKAQVDEKFGGMIKAFTYGAPPHGGIALGVDRIAMLLANEEAIREVIAFPLTQTAEDLLMGAPSPVSDKQLREVHIEVKMPPK